VFYNDLGALRGADVLTLGAYGSGYVQASKCTTRPGVSQAGYAQTSWSSDSDVGVFTLCYNNVARNFYAMPPSKEYELPVYIPYWRRDPMQSEDTLVYVRNASDEPVAGLITFRDRHGYEAGQFNFITPPMGTSMFAASEAGIAGDGCVEVTSSAIYDQSLMVWGMLLNTGTSKACLMEAQEAKGLTIE